MLLKIVAGIWKLIAIVFLELVNYARNYSSSIVRVDGILGLCYGMEGFTW